MPEVSARLGMAGDAGVHAGKGDDGDELLPTSNAPCPSRAVANRKSDTDRVLAIDGASLVGDYGWRSWWALNRGGTACSTPRPASNASDQGLQIELGDGRPWIDADCMRQSRMGLWWKGEPPRRLQGHDAVACGGESRGGAPASEVVRQWIAAGIRTAERREDAHRSRRSEEGAVGPAVDCVGGGESGGEGEAAGIPRAAERGRMHIERGGGGWSNGGSGESDGASDRGGGDSRG
uniref:Expressed protein n=1 Tax=Oryza sativa subsp. japonica TaxID=39947 RepID=Q2QVR9_ORYSJ|nr:expressed protein [Oryza sativa Japonica Group]